MPGSAGPQSCDHTYTQLGCAVVQSGFRDARRQRILTAEGTMWMGY